MRRILVLVALTSVCLSAPAWAQEPRSSVQGFGGLRIGSIGSTPSAETAFGGNIVGSLTSNVQVVGEVGRLSSVLPSSVDFLLGFSPIGARVSAWYGEGGVRLISAPAAVRPYAEASGGIARLHAGLTGDASDIGLFGPVSDAALRFFDRTSPIGTIGGGVRFEGGPFVADVGYRYHRIFADNWLKVLALGQDLNVSEVRFGVGVRF